MKISMNSYDSDALFESVCGQFGAEASSKFREARFEIPSAWGRGEVNYFSFADGLTVWLSNFELNEDFELEYQCEDRSPLYIFFLLNGRLISQKASTEKPIELQSMEILLTGFPASGHFSLLSPKNTSNTLAVFRIDQNKYLSKKGFGLEDLPEKLQWLFNHHSQEVQCLYQPDRSTLNASMLVAEVQQCNLEGLVRSCFIEGKIKELLSIFLGRALEACNESRPGIKLGDHDVQKIKLARDILVQDLQNAPTIEQLSRKAGVNRQKLKQLFKQIFGKTIYQYLREERMQTARCLLMAKEATIQEVARQIGYENTGHFSRRFKEQFGCLPSEFQKMVKTSA